MTTLTRPRNIAAEGYGIFLMLGHPFLTHAARAAIIKYAKTIGVKVT